MSSEFIFHELGENPRVCSNCFRLRHTRGSKPARARRLSNRTIWADAVVEPRYRTRHADSDTPPGDVVSDRTPRTVCECGSFSAFTSTKFDADEPLSKGDLLLLTRNIHETLSSLADEADALGDPDRAERYSHDRAVLFRVVESLKSDPDRQYKDPYILASAVEVASRRGSSPKNGGSRATA